MDQQEIFTDIVEEAKIDTAVLKNLKDVEPKLYKLKRKGDLSIFLEGNSFKVKGTKSALENARHLLNGSLSDKENILVRGIDRAEDVLELLSGGTWGIIENPEKCVKLKKCKKQFPIGLFCTFVSKNTEQVWRKLFDFNCEMKVEGYSNGDIKVILKGSEDFVDDIFVYFEKECNVIGQTLIFHYEFIDVPNRSAFLDILDEQFAAIMICYQGTCLDMVLWETETRTQDQLTEQINEIAEQSRMTEGYPNLTKLLHKLYASKNIDNEGTVGKREKENKKATVHEDMTETTYSSNGKELPLDMSTKNNAANLSSTEERKTIKLDLENIRYLQQCVWENVVDEASNYGINPSVAEDTIVLTPKSNDFEKGCQELEHKLETFLQTVKTITIDVSKVPRDEMSMQKSEIIREADKCKVLASFDTPGKLKAKGKAESLDDFQQNAERLLGLVCDTNPSEPVSEMASTGETTEDGPDTWKRLASDESEPSFSQNQHITIPEQESARVNPKTGVRADTSHNRSHSSSQNSQTMSYTRQELSGRYENTTRHMTIYMHKDSGIKIYCGIADITRLDVDCIVNAANEDLHHYGGVAYAIARAAGDELQKESSAYILEHGPLDIAGVCATTAGFMPCKKVLHTVGPMWSQFPNHNECADKLQEAFLNCLREAEKLHMVSIAFPAISSGIFGVPMYVVSQAACEAICTFCICTEKDTSQVKDIFLVDINRQTIDSFNSALHGYVSNGALSVVSTAV